MWCAVSVTEQPGQPASRWKQARIAAILSRLRVETMALPPVLGGTGYPQVPASVRLGFVVTCEERCGPGFAAHGYRASTAPHLSMLALPLLPTRDGYQRESVFGAWWRWCICMVAVVHGGDGAWWLSLRPALPWRVVRRALTRD